MSTSYYASQIIGHGVGHGRGGEERLEEAQQIRTQADGLLANIDELLGIKIAEVPEPAHVEVHPTSRTAGSKTADAIIHLIDDVL